MFKNIWRSREWKPNTFRRMLNLYPPYFFTGTRVHFIAPDWKKIIVKLHRTFLTNNYVGTIFGGSLYAATDPFYMFMLIKILGIENYIVWDQAAEIYFKKPGRSTVTYTFILTDEQIEAVKKEVAEKGTIRPQFEVQGLDEEGEVCTIVKKTIYIRAKKEGNNG